MESVNIAALLLSLLMLFFPGAGGLLDADIDKAAPDDKSVSDGLISGEKSEFIDGAKLGLTVTGLAVKSAGADERYIIEIAGINIDDMIVPDDDRLVYFFMLTFGVKNRDISKSELNLIMVLNFPEDGKAAVSFQLTDDAGNTLEATGGTAFQDGGSWVVQFILPKNGKYVKKLASYKTGLVSCGILLGNKEIFTAPDAKVHDRPVYAEVKTDLLSPDKVTGLAGEGNIPMYSVKGMLG